MLGFLKHKFTRKDKVLAKWGVEHLMLALVAGAALAAWIVMWQGHQDQGRVEALKQLGTETADQPSAIPPTDTAKIGGPFELTDQNGRPVTDRDFAGKYLLVYFGYTSCPDMCPTGLQSMSVALDQLGTQADAVQPLFITVDPARDTSKRLKEYDASFSPRIIGLTGTAQQIASVANEYQVYYKKGDGDQDYEVDHTSLIYLIAPDGKLVTTFDEQVDPKAIVAAVQNGVAAPASANP